MKLSTKMRYETRAMVDLAQHYEQGLVSAREVAERQQVSAKYLEQLLTTLRSAGLVRSVRGAQGGQQLARPPSQINLREIYNIFEGVQEFAECATCPQICDRTELCVTQDIWSQMYDACMKVLESTTLEDLVLRAKESQTEKIL